MKKGKEYEILIEQLYKKIDPESIIKRNDKILGKNSGILREIDVSIRRQVGPHEVLMIVQAKDYGTKKIDVKIIDEFKAVIEDVNASKGIIISAKGYSKAALNYGKKENIDLLTGHDINNPKWAIDLQMPVILIVYRASYAPNWGFMVTKEYEAMDKNNEIPRAPATPDFKFTIDEGKTYKTLSEIFNDACSKDVLKYYDGEEHTLDCSANKNLKMFVKEGVIVPVFDLKIKYRARKNIYYKYFKIKEFQGFINRHTNSISRANVVVEDQDFTIANYDILNRRQIDLSTWSTYDDNVKLIHPYKMECVVVWAETESGGIKWELKD